MSIEDISVILFFGAAALTIGYVVLRILFRLFAPHIWTKGSPKLLLTFLAVMVVCLLLTALPEKYRGADAIAPFAALLSAGAIFVLGYFTCEMIHRGVLNRRLLKGPSEWGRSWAMVLVIFALAAIALGVVFTHAPVSSEPAGQSARAVEAAVEVFKSNGAELDTTYNKLLDLTETLARVDADRLYPVLIGFFGVRYEEATVSVLAGVLSNMADPRDAAVIRKVLSTTCVHFGKNTSEAVQSANETLPKFTSPELIQEITKARDQVAQLGSSQLCKLFPPEAGG